MQIGSPRPRTESYPHPFASAEWNVIFPGAHVFKLKALSYRLNTQSKSLEYWELFKDLYLNKCTTVQ